MEKKYLQFTGPFGRSQDLGELGKQAEFKDSKDQPLCVGDLVLMIFKPTANHVASMVVDYTEDSTCSILGAQGAEHDGDITIIKIGSYEDLVVAPDNTLIFSDIRLDVIEKNSPDE